MGNNIGFEADEESVKLAYVEVNESNIEFVRGLESRFLISEFKWGQATAFLFQCSIEEFLHYPTSHNVKLLRDQYISMLAGDKFLIKTNRQTISKIKRLRKLEEALQAILMRQFELVHHERIESAVESMNVLEKSDPFFYFSNLVQLTELHTGLEKMEKKVAQKIPHHCLVLMLRSGTTAYRVRKGEKAKRIGGSIIGEKTILSILQTKIPQKTTQQILEMAMHAGNLKNVDMMVEDIYGTNTALLGLPADIIASTLGKLGKMAPSELAEQRDEDIARALLTGFAINTAQLAVQFLWENQMEDVIVMADLCHYDKFYYLLQSIFSVFAPGKNIMFCRHSPFIPCLGNAFEK